jgi:hypothetical protein
VRRLIRASPCRTALLTGGAFVGLGAAAGWLLAGCGTSSQGVRKEGPARTEWTSVAADPGAYAGGAASTRSPAPRKADAIRLVKADPKVSADLKASLKPCPKEPKGSERITGYPVDVAHGRLTGSAASDLVVNVMTCADGFGIGSYVYRKVGQRYENVFSDEQPPVYADVAKGDLRVTKLSYASGDAVCCPSWEDVITYRWAGQRRVFTVVDRKHTDYSKNPPTEDPAPSADGTEG